MVYDNSDYVGYWIYDSDTTYKKQIAKLPECITLNNYKKMLECKIESHEDASISQGDQVDLYHFSFQNKQYTIRHVMTRGDSVYTTVEER